MNATAIVDDMESNESETTRRAPKILVVDDESAARSALVTLLTDDGYRVRDASDGYKALGKVKEWEPDVLLTDIRMPLMDGLALIREAREALPGIACVVMTAFGSIESAVEAMKSGADDYLTKPLNFDHVEIVLERVVERLDMSRELARLRSARSRDDGGPIIGTSPPLKEVLKLADQVANSRATILVTGESGTGKEMIARRIHRKSTRADRPFVSLHCAALPDTLLESELFGHEKGSFTGATGQREGRFEEADGGTLFMDEIGEITGSTQVKLLRFLQTREFERVGGNETISVDVRIIAATNRNLEQAVREGNFREDLYYRLNVINIETPSLRARRSDIPVLARHFVSKYAAENEKSVGEIDPEFLSALEGYDWPGNVRELENVVERAVVLCDGGTLLPSHLPGNLGQGVLASTISGDIRIPGSTLEDIEKFAILETYKNSGGNTRDTADVLGISQRKVQYKLNDYREEGEDV